MDNAKKEITEKIRRGEKLTQAELNYLKKLATNFIERFKRRFEVLASTMLGSKVKLELAIGGASFTNLTTDYIRVAITSNDFLFCSEDEQVNLVRFLTCHETAHRLWTNPKMGDEAREKANAICKDILAEGEHYSFCQAILNIMEDGRIENLLCNKFKGLVELRKWARLREWSNDYMINDDDSRYMALVNNLLSLSTARRHARRFTDIYPVDTEEGALMDRLIPSINGYITSLSIEDGEKYYLDVIEGFTNLMKDEIGADSGDERVNLPEDLKDRMEKNLESQSQMNNESGKNVPTSNNYAPIDNQDEFTKNGNSGVSNPNLSGAGSNSEEVSKTVSKTDAETVSGTTSSMVSDAALDVESTKKMLSEMSSSMFQQEEAACMREKAREANKSKEKQDSLSAQESISATANVGITIEEIRLQPKRNNVKLSCPPEISTKGKKVRRRMKTLLEVNPVINLKNQYQGTFDTRCASKFVIGKSDCFKNKIFPAINDCCCYILKDDSGSMIDFNRETYAINALSELEVAFKGLMPLKINAFASSYRENIITMIKDWSEDEQHSYTQSFAWNHYPVGGTDEASALFHAANELMKRVERKKLLIIISDGCSGNPENVLKTVKWARKNGVFVVSLFIGADTSEKDLARMYDNQYYTCCSPDKLSGELLKFVKRFVNS